MARLTEAQRRAFARQIAEIMKDHQQELADAGFDPSERISELEQLCDIAEDKEAAQVAAREALRKATAESRKATREAYKFASATVELIVGLLGKDHPLSKILRNLRDEMALEAQRGKKKGQKPQS